MEGFTTQVNAFTRVKPLFYLYKLIGLAPVTPIITRHPERTYEVKFQTSRLGIVYTVFMTTAIFVSFLAFCINIAQTCHESIAEQLCALKIARCTISMFLGAGSLVYSVTKSWDGINEIFRLLTLVDDMFCLKSLEEYSSNSQWVLIHSISMLVVLVMVSLLDMMKFSAPVLVNMELVGAFYIPYIISYAISLWFFYLNLTVKQRFACLNIELDTIFREVKIYGQRKVLRNHIHRQAQERLVFKPNSGILLQNREELLVKDMCKDYPGSVSLRLEELHKIHSILCDTPSLVMSICGLQIFFVMVNALFSITGNVYYLSDLILRRKMGNITSPHNKEPFTILLWILSNLLQIIIIAHSANLVSDYSKITLIPIQKMTLLENMSQKDMVLVQLFIQQVLTRKVKYNVMGLFPLDHTLLVSISSLILTYFIVLIQLSPTLT